MVLEQRAVDCLESWTIKRESERLKTSMLKFSCPLFNWLSVLGANHKGFSASSRAIYYGFAPCSSKLGMTDGEPYRTTLGIHRD